MRYTILTLLACSSAALAQAPAPAPAAPVAPATDAKALIEHIDALWSSRDEGENPKTLEQLTTEALKAAPDDYGVLWRASRWHLWLGDGLPNGDAKEKEGKLGWEIGDKATAKNPTAGEGWYYSAACIGIYSQAIGVVNALLKGLEGKFLDRLNKAIEISPDINFGGPPILKGRYYYELPWPKYDGDKSLEWYKKAVAKFPKSARLHLYTAETLLKEGKAKEANEENAACLSVSPGTYDAPDERRMHGLAEKLKVKIERELK